MNDDFWLYQLVDFGRNAEGNHAGVAISEVHYRDGKPAMYSGATTFQSFDDDFDNAVNADHRASIVAQLERALKAVKDHPILPASEIGQAQ